MSEIKNFIQQKPYLFDNIANRWHQATQGDLAILSTQGEILKGYNHTPNIFQELIDISIPDKIQLVDDTQTIMTPVRLMVR